MLKEPDRENFDEKIRTMHLAYNRTVDETKLQAYWQVLIHMPRERFDGVMAHVLSENAPDELPSAQRLWKISRTLSAPRVGGLPAFAPPTVEEDLLQPSVYYARAANKALLDYIRLRAGGGLYRYGQSTMPAGPRDHTWVVQVSKRMQLLVPLLVSAKNAYVLEMVECPESRPDSKKIWDELMANTESEVDRLSSQPLPLEVAA